MSSAGSSLSGYISDNHVERHGPHHALYVSDTSAEADKTMPRPSSVATSKEEGEEKARESPADETTTSRQMSCQVSSESFEDRDSCKK